MRPKENYRLARINHAVIEGRLKLNLGRVAYVDRAWTGERGADRRLVANPDRTVQDLIAEVDATHLSSGTSIEKMSTWPRSAALHSSILLFTPNREAIVTIRGPETVGGSGELTTTAAGGSQYWRLRLQDWMTPGVLGLDPGRATIERELMEETAIEILPAQMAFLGVGMYPTRVGWDPEFHYTAELPGDWHVVLRNWMANARDSGESLRAFPMSLGKLKWLGLKADIPYSKKLTDDDPVDPGVDFKLNPPLVMAIHFLGRLFTEPGQDAFFEFLDQAKDVPYDPRTTPMT